MIIALAALLVSATAAPPPIALAPNGSWVLEGEDNMCALLHSYGDKRDQLTFGVRPWPLNDRTDLLVVQEGGVAGVERGIATIVPEGAQEPLIGDYFAYTLKNGDRRLTTITIEGAPGDMIARAASISVRVGKRAPLVIAQPPATKAFLALEDCEKTLLGTLHVDREALARVVTPAKAIGDKARWFTPGDYPQGALSGGQQGNTRILMTIGTDGRVTACTPFGTSGSAEMDKAACSVIMRRGRLTPARDGQGQPIVSYQTETIRWSIG
jgi:TonB family protein